MSQNLLLEDLIQKALSKVKGKKERDLCRFLPCSRGYMHHFTFRKMMHDSPQQLFDLIQEYIIEPEKPQEIQLKPIEQSYQTNKRMKQFNISEDEMDRMLHVARQAQDLELKNLRLNRVSIQMMIETGINRAFRDHRHHFRSLIPVVLF